MPTNDARDLNLQVEKKAVKALYEIQSSRHLGDIFLNWGIILTTAIFCSLYFHPLLYVLTITIIGARMHALAILMHDAAHFRFLKNRKHNDLLTNYLTMYFIFSSIEVYRKNHLKHHQHLNTEDEPDWFFKIGRRDFTYPKSRAEFILTVLAYFTMIRGFLDAIWFLKRFAPANTPGAKKKASLKSKLPRIFFYVILATVLSIFGLWKAYLLYWVIPYLSTFFMFQYVRSVSEHFGELERDHLLNSTRTVKTNLFERFFFAPHNVSYHLEHHLYPGVPYYNLPQLHDLLMEQEIYREKAHITNGYLGGLVNELSKI
ncbi:MAG: fatty acid desaturase family protein [Bacteroidota bacterium]